MPAYMDLNIRTIIDNLFLPDHERREAHKLLVKITNNLRAMGVIDDQGQQVKGHLIGQLRGIDGLFIYHCLMKHEWLYEQSRELVEFLVDHDVIQRLINRKEDEKRREWIRERLRERRRENPLVSWEDVEAEYESKFPRPLHYVEKIHKEFLQLLPHPEMHERKTYKNVWALIEEADCSFMAFVEEHKLEREEGSLFSYLARVMKTAKMLHEVTWIPDFRLIDQRIRSKLAVLDERILDQW